MAKTRGRPLKLFRFLLENEEKFSLKYLAEYFDVSTDTIKDDIQTLKEGGIIVTHSDYPDYFYFVENAKLKNDEIIIKTKIKHFKD
jgi:biotin operon repressor